MDDGIILFVFVVLVGFFIFLFLGWTKKRAKELPAKMGMDTVEVAAFDNWDDANKFMAFLSQHGIEAMSEEKRFSRRAYPHIEIRIFENQIEATKKIVKEYDFEAMAKKPAPNPFE